MSETKIFDGLFGVLSAAVGAAAMVFGLFGFVLTDLVPPIADSRYTVGVAAFATAGGLIILAVLIHERLTAATVRKLAWLSMVMFVVAIIMFFYFRDMTRTYVYRYPPASISNEGQTRHIRGDLHAAGIKLVGGMTIAEAVYELGAPDKVNSMGILWDEKSYVAISNKLERLYVILVMLLTTAIFIAGLAYLQKRKKMRMLTK